MMSYNEFMVHCHRYVLSRGARFCSESPMHQVAFALRRNPGFTLCRSVCARSFLERGSAYIYSEIGNLMHMIKLGEGGKPILL